MIVYTEKLENAIIIAAAHQPLRYHGSVVKFSDLTPEILAGLSAEFTQFGFIRSQIGNEEALLTWGEGLLRMRGLRDLKPEEYLAKDPGGVILPKDITYEPVPEKASEAELLRAILLHEDHKVIYNACIGEDAAYSFMKVYESFNLKQINKKVLRVNIRSMTEKEIKLAFANPLSETASMNEIITEKARRYIYWISNLNISAGLYALSSGKANIPIRYIPFLAAIAKQSKKRETGEEIIKYRIAAQASFEGSTFSLACKAAVFSSKEAAADAMKALPECAVIIRREESLTEELAKGPYSTQALLQAASTHPKAGFRPEKTQALLSSLYEKGFIRNIQTSSRKYGASQKKEILSLLEMLRSVDLFQGMLHSINLFDMPAAYFGKDESCGIIITGKRPSDEMTGEEKVLYALIAYEMVKTAYPPRLLKKITCTAKLGAYLFSVSDKKVVTDGYAALEKKRASYCQIPDLLEEGSVIKLSYGIEPVKIAAAEFYTEQDIIKSFTAKKASAYTAADVTYGVNLLLAREFIVRKDKKLLATELGEKIILLLQDFPTLQSGKLIADWEYTLSRIAGCDTVEDAVKHADSLSDKVYTFLEDFQKQLRATQGGPTAIPCPRCGASLHRGQMRLSCNDCGWKIQNQLSGRMFTERELAFLIKNKSTPIIPGFSDGERNVRGRIYLDDCLKPVFTKDSQYSCPACGRKLHVAESGDKYFCPEESCSFEVKFSYYGHTFTNEELHALLIERITPIIPNLKNNQGAFSARFYVDPAQGYSVRLAIVGKK